MKMDNITGPPWTGNPTEATQINDATIISDIRAAMDEQRLSPKRPSASRRRVSAQGQIAAGAGSNAIKATTVGRYSYRATPAN